MLKQPRHSKTPWLLWMIWMIWMHEVLMPFIIVSHPWAVSETEMILDRKDWCWGFHKWGYPPGPPILGNLHLLDGLFTSGAGIMENDFCVSKINSYDMCSANVWGLMLWSPRPIAWRVSTATSMARKVIPQIPAWCFVCFGGHTGRLQFCKVSISLQNFPDVSTDTTSFSARTR